jgi:hypothetical protein
MDEEEEFILWQDILDEVAAGRTAGHACPFCRQGPLLVEQGDRGRVRIVCPNCKKFIEGAVGSDENYY